MLMMIELGLMAAFLLRCVSLLRIAEARPVAAVAARRGCVSRDRRAA